MILHGEPAELKLAGGASESQTTRKEGLTKKNGGPAYQLCGSRNAHAGIAEGVCTLAARTALEEKLDEGNLEKFQERLKRNMMLLTIYCIIRG